MANVMRPSPFPLAWEQQRSSRDEESEALVEAQKRKGEVLRKAGENLSEVQYKIVNEDYFYGKGKSLENRVLELEDKVKTLENKFQNISKLLEDTDEIIELRNVSYDQAREEIARYFREHDGEEIGYEELVEELRIDPGMVVRVCDELMKEGKIG